MMSDMHYLRDDCPADGADRSRPATVTTSPLPLLPMGYTALNQPRPLIVAEGQWWICKAHYTRYNIDGFLVYQDCFAVAFFTAEEATTVLYCLLEHAADLLAGCSEPYQQEHASGVKLVRDVLWIIETRKARALASRSPSGTMTKGG